MIRFSSKNQAGWKGLSPEMHQNQAMVGNMGQWRANTGSDWTIPIVFHSCVEFYPPMVFHSCWQNRPDVGTLQFNSFFGRNLFPFLISAGKRFVWSSTLRNSRELTLPSSTCFNNVQRFLSTGYSVFIDVQQSKQTWRQILAHLVSRWANASCFLTFNASHFTCMAWANHLKTTTSHCCNCIFQPAKTVYTGSF